jgi:DNA mismatch endonuclease (patch repair protein)
MQGHSVADIMNAEKRSALMSRIRSKNTGIERTVFRELSARGVRFSKHVAKLPGKPDVVFKRQKVVVFIDGDFWHGWQFPRWRAKLRPYWRVKIERNRNRDRKNFRRLRQKGWTVIRIWEHNVETDLSRFVDLIIRTTKNAASALLR